MALSPTFNQSLSCGMLPAHQSDIFQPYGWCEYALTMSTWWLGERAYVYGSQKKSPRPLGAGARGATPSDERPRGGCVIQTGTVVRPPKGSAEVLRPQ